MDPSIFKSFTYNGLMKLIEKYAPVDPSAPFSSKDLQKIFTGNSLLFGNRKFHPKGEADNQLFYDTKNPDIAISYTWGLDLRRELPHFFEQLRIGLRDTRFIHNFDNLTFWLDIFFVDQNSKNLALDLNEAQKTYVDARLHVFFLFRDPLSRGWILFEIGVRAWAVQTEFHLEHEELISILSNGDKHKQSYISRKDWNEYKVSHLLSRSFTQFIVCDKITDVDTDLSKYCHLDTFSSMMTTQEQDKPMIRKRLEQLLGSSNQFNLIIKAFAKKEMRKLGRAQDFALLEDSGGDHSKSQFMGNREEASSSFLEYLKHLASCFYPSRSHHEHGDQVLDIRPSCPAPIRKLSLPSVVHDDGLPQLSAQEMTSLTRSEVAVYEYVKSRHGTVTEVKDLVELVRTEGFTAHDVGTDLHQRMMSAKLNQLEGELTREDFVFKAKLSEQTERYEEMSRIMTRIAQMGGELTVEERNLLSVAFKNVASALRASFRTISAKEKIEKAKGPRAEQRLRHTRQYGRRIAAEASSVYGNVLAILDRLLIPGATSEEAKVFFHKMRGDHLRYFAEVSTGAGRKDAVELAGSAYTQADQIAQAKLPPTHPIRLGLSLNYSVFCFEVLGSVERARDLAKRAFDEAITELDTLSEEAYKDSTLIMQLLRDNLTLWNSDDDDAAEPQGLRIGDEELLEAKIGDLAAETYSREDHMFLAQLAELAERYEDMVKSVVCIAKLDVEFSSEERNYFSVAYKNVVGAYRASYRVISSMEERANGTYSGKQSEEIRKYRVNIEWEIKNTCDNVLAILDRHLIPTASTSESKVFFHKMKGDYLRYSIDISTGAGRKEAGELAGSAYAQADQIARAELPPTHPIRLGLSLNYSVFCYEFLGSVQRACEVAKGAFDEAIAELDTLDEDSYRDSTLIMQLLRDNLTMWTSDADE